MIPQNVPKPIHPNFTFRNFVEFIGDNSPLFATSSGVAKLVMLLSGLDKAKNGKAQWDESARDLLRAALNAEGDSAVSIRISVSDKKTGKQVGFLPPRALLPYLTAIMENK